ncbi:hypothetical protein DPMN_163508 [Dreissena polymorpha]|uniref:Uncharacterized protein n=1 Tax=Dreissena polymorpha TaxID=45954 RepID=A0A9D4ISW0_DREPO|nr:hypothetical protein DPMN_163508 [Dreissena polymorpha]
MVSHYALLLTDDRKFRAHTAIDSRIRCVPADANDVSSCAVLYIVDAEDLLGSPYSGAIVDDPSYF